MSCYSITLIEPWKQKRNDAVSHIDTIDCTVSINLDGLIRTGQVDDGSQQDEPRGRERGVNCRSILSQDPLTPKPQHHRVHGLLSSTITSRHHTHEVVNAIDVAYRVLIDSKFRVSQFRDAGLGQAVKVVKSPPARS